MNRYYDGFDSCSDSNTPPTTTSKGTFKIIVEVQMTLLETFMVELQ